MKISWYLGGNKEHKQMTDVLPSFHSRLETVFDMLAVQS